MDNIDDYIQALKETCTEKNNDFYDSIEFDDKIMKVSCNGSNLYVEICYKVRLTGYPMDYEQLKHILEAERLRIKRQSTDTDEHFKSKKISITRNRKLVELLGDE